MALVVKDLLLTFHAHTMLNVNTMECILLTTDDSTAAEGESDTETVVQLYLTSRDDEYEGDILLQMTGLWMQNVFLHLESCRSLDSSYETSHFSSQPVGFNITFNASHFDRLHFDLHPIQANSHVPIDFLFLGVYIGFRILFSLIRRMNASLLTKRAILSIPFDHRDGSNSPLWWSQSPRNYSNMRLIEVPQVGRASSGSLLNIKPKAFLISTPETAYLMKTSFMSLILPQYFALNSVRLKTFKSGLCHHLNDRENDKEEEEEHEDDDDSTITSEDTDEGEYQERLISSLAEKRTPPRQQEHSFEFKTTINSCGVEVPPIQTATLRSFTTFNTDVTILETTILKTSDVDSPFFI